MMPGRSGVLRLVEHEGHLHANPDVASATARLVVIGGSGMTVSLPGAAAP